MQRPLSEVPLPVKKSTSKICQGITKSPQNETLASANLKKTFLTANFSLQCDTLPLCYSSVPQQKPCRSPMSIHFMEYSQYQSVQRFLLTPCHAGGHETEEFKHHLFYLQNSERLAFFAG